MTCISSLRLPSSDLVWDETHNLMSSIEISVQIHTLLRESTTTGCALTYGYGRQWPLNKGTGTLEDPTKRMNKSLSLYLDHLDYASISVFLSNCLAHSEAVHLDGFAENEGVSFPNVGGSGTIINNNLRP